MKTPESGTGFVAVGRPGPLAVDIPVHLSRIHRDERLGISEVFVTPETALRPLSHLGMG
jgi:hypothetical protein